MYNITKFPSRDVARGLLQRHSRWGSKSTRDKQRYPEVRPRTHPSPALAGRSSAGGVQAVCNGSSMFVAQSKTVHDGLLHPHLSPCSSTASAVYRLPSAVRTSTTAFDVPSSGIFCGRSGGLGLVTRLPVTSVTSL